MKRYIILLFAITFSLSGCQKNLLPTKVEINHIELVQVLGIDKKDNAIEITVLSKIDKGSEGKNGGGNSIISIISETGPTIFEAVRNFMEHSEKMISFAHNDYFIFGEDAVKDDFTKYFDVVSRDADIRLTPKVYISKGCSAKELISQTYSADKYIVDRLKNMMHDKDITGKTDQVKIIDVMNMLDDPNSATIIPALMLKEISDEKSTGDIPKKDIVTAGYAVIRDFRLAGYIDNNYSRGYNFLVNKINSTPITVNDFSGSRIGLEVISSKTEVKTHFTGDSLDSVTYTTYVKSNIEEQHSRINISNDYALNDLAQKQSEIIKDEIDNVLKLSKDYNIDCTNLRRYIQMKHPIKWNSIKDKWRELYPDLKINVIVKSQISRTYDIKEPNGYNQDK